MPWNATFDDKLRYVEVVYQGPITAPDLAAANVAAIRLGKERETICFLVDLVDVRLDASLADLYQLPAKQYVDEGVDPRTRIALIMPPSKVEQDRAKFYENACVNRGWQTRSFDARQDAIEWLTKGES